MSAKKVRFYCHYCKKTLVLNLSEEFQQKFTQTADKWPYPLVYRHEDHFAIIYLDEDFIERGITVSRIEFTD